MSAMACCLGLPQSLAAFANSALAVCRLEMPLFIMPGSSMSPDCISLGVDSALTPSVLKVLVHRRHASDAISAPLVTGLLQVGLRDS